MMFGIQRWNVFDPAPDVPLAEIADLSVRARAMLVRNQSAARLQYAFVQTDGAIDMMSGLQHHHDAFAAICRRLARRQAGATDESALRHEAVAYLNRLGQFHGFARSEFVARAIADPDAVLPTVRALMVFRNKHAAHRSVDQPHRADTETLQFSHARSLSTLGGSLFVPKARTRPISAARLRTTEDLPAFNRALFRRCHLSFQIPDAIGDFVNFTPELDHPTIMAETYALIERIILGP